MCTAHRNSRTAAAEVNGGRGQPSPVPPFSRAAALPSPGPGAPPVSGASPTAAGSDGDVPEGAPGGPVAMAGLTEVPRLVDVVVVEVAKLGLLALAPGAWQRLLRLHRLHHPGRLRRRLRRLLLLA
ncbi:unnamed protein product [Musa hybrid cultivar]